jgi:hypothetical protein
MVRELAPEIPQERLDEMEWPQRLEMRPWLNMNEEPPANAQT